MTNPTDNASSKASASKLLLILTGVLIPIFSALIPVAIDYSKASGGLTYKVMGPVSVQSTYAFSLTISNNGRVVEKNVEIWFPDILPEKTTTYESTIPVEFKRQGKKILFSVGDLRPNESVTISVLTSNQFLALLENKFQILRGVRVVSSDHVAESDGPSDEMEFIYRAGFWAFILIFFVALVWAIYVEHFMDRKKKEAMILKEIEKLK
jgi:hypothetical protein